MESNSATAAEWVPAYGPDTALLNMDTLLCSSLIAWLLAKLLPEAGDSGASA